MYRLPSLHYSHISFHRELIHFHPVRGKKGSKLIHLYPTWGKFWINIDSFLPQNGVKKGHHFILLRMAPKSSIAFHYCIQMCSNKIVPDSGYYTR